MKIILAILLTASAALAQTVTTATDVKDASNPKDVVIIGEIHAGTIAEALDKYPNLKAKLDAAAKLIAKDKEKALLKVKDADAPRAKIKMDELLAAGVPISKATQDAVMKAALPPSPKGSPTPSPSPTPNDGLD